MAVFSETLVTYNDMLSYLNDYLEGGVRSKDRNSQKQIILGAYNNVVLGYRWAYYDKEGRIDLSASYTTGTVTFDLAGHAQGARALTLATGTWPSWVKFGRIRFNDKMYIIADTTADGAVVVLDSVFTPTADISTGVAYELFRSTYPMPDDLWSLEEVIVEESYWITHYIPPTEWLRRERFWNTTGQTWAWTLMEDPDAITKWAFRADPSPDSAEPLGFIYRRRPRTLRWAGTETAAATYTATGSSAASTLTTSTGLPASMVGAILRLSDSTTTNPTGLTGQNPYIEQHRIKSISGTTVTLDATTLSQAYDSVNMIISDPIDMPDQMVEALKAAIEYRLARFSRKSSEIANSYAIHKQAMRTAMENDRRYDMNTITPTREHFLFRHLGTPTEQ